ncbi:MAG: hypothetical protein PVJ04_16785, partial [Gemmatimonadota bacterium]
MKTGATTFRGVITGVLPGLRVLSVFLLLACGGDGSGPPGTLRFGQVGEVRVALQVPLAFKQGQGELWQIIAWNSGGLWQLEESISYRGLLGDQSRTRKEGDPASYGFLIAQLHEAPLDLFDSELIPVLPEGCPSGTTEVTLTVRDDLQGEEITWIRCSEGNLATLKTSGAGPDQDALRVIQAAILVRDFTEGRNFISAYSGSVPFGTLDRGEDSGARLEEPVAFFSEKEGSLDTPDGWVSFWRAHTGDPRARPPVVDWANEMVFVAAVGRREEAGDSVEIHRVLQTGEETRITIFELVPGDFCSPAARDHYPVHIVVAPRTLLPVRFSDLVTERFP